MKWLVLFIFFAFSSAHALENDSLMRSPRGMLMGDAFTAVTDDEFSLFYNPASLARHKRDFTLYPFNPVVSATNIFGDMKKFKNFPTDPVGASDLLMDYPVHASAGIAPGFKLFNFGVNFIANNSFDAILRNKTHPMLDLDMHNDRGLIMGMGIPLGPGRINRKSNIGSQTSLGMSAKYIERTGVLDTLSLSGPTVIDSISRKDLASITQSLGQVKGTGWGFDAGLEHVVKQGNSQVIVGLSALDITGTDFKVTKNQDNLKVANIRSKVNMGLAAGQDFKLFHYILSADIRGLNQQSDFGQKVRLGAQVGIPGLTLMGGVNSGYYSYGATVNLGFIKVTTGFYSVEMGSHYQQIKSKQFLLYVSLFDFSFDA